MVNPEEKEEEDPMQEKIWDLHDKLSDAILSSHHYYDNNNRNKPRPPANTDTGDGFVFFNPPDSFEAKSLNAIRAALENLEHHLHFFRAVQVQQRVEKDSAIVRLEQSRVFLAKILSEHHHHGKRYKVIEEALEFVGDAGQFVSTNFTSAPSSPGKKLVTHKGIRLNLMKVIVNIFGFVKKSVKVKEFGGVLGNAALIAFSMLALLHLHKTGSHDKYILGLPEENAFHHRNVRRNYRFEDSSSSNRLPHLEVTLARG